MLEQAHSVYFMTAIIIFNNTKQDSVDGRGSNSPYFRPVPAENRYQVERLTELEQDNIKLRMRLEDSVPKVDVKKLEAPFRYACATVIA
jgi:hypothetical protein